MRVRTRIPVFPLPNCVLLPGVGLPLHIFEPRYREMVRDLQDSDTHLAVALADETTPGVFQPRTVAGAGRVRLISTYADGRFDILVIGLYRVRIRSFVIQTKPYLVADCVILGEQETPLAAGEGDGLESELRRLMLALYAQRTSTPAKKEPDRIREWIEKAEGLGTLANFGAFHFLEDALEKQRALESGDALERARFVFEALERTLAAQPQTVGTGGERPSI